MFDMVLQYDHRVKVVKDRPVEISEKKASNKNYDQSLINWDKNSPRKSPNLEGFNDTAYIITGRRDKDSYKLNSFNQEESDKLHSDRTIPDTRHYQ